jgi:hypothetical protein
MALLLRKVKQNRWFKEPAARYIEAGDVPADPFADLQTRENLLSVFEVEPDRSNLMRIVRALALGCNNIDHTGYILFDSDQLTPAEIQLRASTGQTHDKGINDRHRDLVLSGKKLLALARLLLEHGETGTILKPVLEESIEEGIKAGELPERCRRRK